tara:strand:+ start:974 stop:1279 length:306 start_codon:yes stop_codon:yes gene_type:complete
MSTSDVPTVIVAVAVPACVLLQVPPQLEELDISYLTVRFALLIIHGVELQGLDTVVVQVNPVTGISVIEAVPARSHLKSSIYLYTFLLKFFINYTFKLPNK